MKLGRGAFLSAAAAATLIAAAACSSSPTSGSDDVERGVALEIRHQAGVFVLTQVMEPEVVMDALYTGGVSADAGGCLRLDGPDDATVVWPKGFGVRSADGGIVVVDASGQVVGRTGDDFRLGGGEVDELHEGLGFTAADRALAAARCPGKFWIATAGEVSAQ